jgi:SAM-dependent methyltransferase
MDGFPNKKQKPYKGELVSDNRFYVNTWLERELPLLSGKVVNIGAGGSLLPKKLLDHSKVTKYTTFDRKMYGDSKNPVDVYGDVEKMPADWTGAWDAAIMVEVMECVPNPFNAVKELHRILKPGGVILITSPFNVSWFGYGSTPDSLKKKNHVKDYWRITKDGWNLLMSSFNTIKVEGFGGTGEYDRFNYCIKGVK